MGEVRRPALELRDLFAKPKEVSLFVDQSGTQLDNAFDRAGHAFAEPKSPRVIFPGVVNRFQRLRADALDVPEMEEFVSGDAS